MKTEDKEAGLIIVKLTYALTTIQYICEMLKQNNKKKIDIDSILRITKSVLESEQQ